MKVGVLQFFSWSRRIPLAEVYARAFSRIEIMDQTGYDCVWLAEHHFNTYSVCPSINVMASHVAARTRTLRIGMAVSLAAFYNPAAPRRGGRPDRRAVGRPRELGRRPRLRPRRVRGLRRARRGELGPLPRVRGDRAGGVAAGAHVLPGTVLVLRRHRGAAQAVAGAAPAGVAGRHVSRFHPARRGEGVRHPAGPARHPRGHRQEARALLRGPARARLPHGGPGDPDGAPARRRRHRAGGRGHRPRGRRVDGDVLRQPDDGGLGGADVALGSEHARGPAGARPRRRRPRGALPERRRDPRHSRPRGRQDRRAARDHRARLPDVRAAQPRHASCASRRRSCPSCSEAVTL